MALYDLTHPLNDLTPVYPGSRQPRFTPVASLQKEQYREKRMEISGHTGTHMDAPAHMLEEGITLDKYPLSHFAGKATILSIPEGTGVISVDLLQSVQESIADADWLLLVTGWSRYWGSDGYFIGFPVLTEDAARWITEKELKGIGVDAVSVDTVESTNWPVHHIFFNAGMVIVENLVFPEEFKPGTAEFYCFPLKISEADGSPVRAVLKPTDE